MAVRGPTDVLNKIPQFLRHCQQHFIVIIIGVCQERDELRASPFFAQGNSDGAQPLD